MKWNECRYGAVVCICSAMLVGCAGYGNSALPEKGAAVQNITERQTAYPDREVKDGHPGLDGNIATRVVNTYRADTANRDAVRNTIQVNIGGGQ